MGVWCVIVEKARDWATQSGARVFLQTSRLLFVGIACQATKTFEAVGIIAPHWLIRWSK